MNLNIKLSIYQSCFAFVFPKTGNVMTPSLQAGEEGDEEEDEEQARRS